jgi:peroxiredoxin Q/BCP
MSAHTQTPKVGDVAPNFDLPATGGQQVSLSNLRGKSVVLYFYPKDSTPGCTLEGRDFTRLHDAFKELGAEVYGVSRDDLKSHEKFKSTECYSIDLLSDTNSELCNAFGVIKEKNMYGRQVMGIERSTFVIDPDGKLAQEWRGVKVDGHADQVLAFLRSQQQN